MEKQLPSRPETETGAETYRTELFLPPLDYLGIYTVLLLNASECTSTLLSRVYRLLVG